MGKSRSIRGEMDYRVMSGKEILDALINSVVFIGEITPEEIEAEESVEYEDTYDSISKHRHLKICYVESSITPNEIKGAIYKRAEVSRKARNLINSFDIEVIEKENPYWLLIFKNRKDEREHFYLVDILDNYWEICTLERSFDLYRTLKRFIEDSDKVGVVWVARNRLKGIVKELVSSDSIHGFTAKKQTIESDKRITIRVYGGDETHLDKAKQHFDAEPTSIYFRKRGSAVRFQGALMSEGGMRVEKILPTFLPEFKSIKDEIKKKYIKEEYEPTIPQLEEYGLDKIGGRFVLDKNEEVIAQTFETFHSFIFEIQDGWDEKKIVKAIKKRFVDSNTSKGYIGYRWFDTDSYFIHDTEFGGLFKLRLWRDRKSVIVNPDKGVSDKSASNFCRTFINSIEHSVKIRSIHKLYST